MMYRLDLVHGVVVAEAGAAAPLQQIVIVLASTLAKTLKVMLTTFLSEYTAFYYATATYSNIISTCRILILVR